MRFEHFKISKRFYCPRCDNFFSNHIWAKQKDVIYSICNICGSNRALEKSKNQKEDLQHYGF